MPISRQHLLPLTVLVAATFSCSDPQESVLRIGDPQTAVLRIETEMHMAPIVRADVDAAGRLLATGSHDKTVRVWDLDNGTLLHVLRPPIGDGNEGKIYAVALSPNGELVAAGGWTGYEWDESLSIYLFDRKSGRLQRRISGLSNVVLHLTFDHEGTRLATTLGGNNGVHVFRTVDGELLARDTEYDDHSYAADFDDAGRIVTSSYDGHIRLYNHGLELLAKVEAPGGEQPFGVAFSPDGQRIAVGYDDTTRVDVLSGGDLTLLYSADSQGAKSNLSEVVWSADGHALIAAGRFNRDGTSPIRRWTDLGRGAYQDLDGPGNTVIALHALSDGRLVFSAADPSWGVLDATGKIVRSRRPEMADLRALHENFRVDASGKTVHFAFQPLGKRPALFSLTERLLEENPRADPRLIPPKLEVEGIKVTGWQDTTEPRLNDQLLPLDDGEISRGLAIAPDGRSFLLGTEWHLRSFTHSGEELWRKSVPTVTWAVNIAQNGRLAIAAFADGTIRWFRYSDGEELLTFFPHADGRRWVLWTPSGFYDASTGGEKLLGWHVDNGPDAAADFVPVHDLRDRFYSPQVIDAVLDEPNTGYGVRKNSRNALPNTNAYTEKTRMAASIESPRRR